MSDLFCSSNVFSGKVSSRMLPEGVSGLAGWNVDTVFMKILSSDQVENVVQF